MIRKPNARYVLVSGGKAFDRRTLVRGQHPAEVKAAPKEVLPAETMPEASFEHFGGDILDDEKHSQVEQPSTSPSNVAGAEQIVASGEKPTLMTKMRSAMSRFRPASKDDEAGKTRAFVPVKPEISEEHLYEGGGSESIFTRRTKPRSLVLSIFFSVLKMLLVLVLALGFAGLGAVTGIARAYVDTSPELDIGLIENQAQTSVIYDGNGNVITTFAGLENREWILQAQRGGLQAPRQCGY